MAGLQTCLKMRELFSASLPLIRALAYLLIVDGR